MDFKENRQFSALICQKISCFLFWLLLSWFFYKTYDIFFCGFYDNYDNYDRKTALAGLGQPLTSKNQPPAGPYLLTVFSYWSNRISSIDLISSIYKFFSSSLIKLFFFFKSFFFFKVSFVFVFSKIDWKRSNVSSSIIYNWL